MKGEPESVGDEPLPAGLLDLAASHPRPFFFRAWRRVRQVVLGWGGPPSDRALEEVAAWLPPAAFALWQRQTPRDQKHSLRVFHLLRQWGCRDRPLLVAALLHDVGKVEARLRLWHRVVWVLVQALWPRAARHLAQPEGWRRPFWVLAEHPRLGAGLARAAGCDEDAVWLIAHHQEKPAEVDDRRWRWLRCLQMADEAS